MERNATRCACGTPASCQSPQASGANASPDSVRRRRLGGLACDLFGTLVLDGRRVPVGPCWILQSRDKTVLSWTETDGADKDREVSAPLLRQLLDEGLLQRRKGA
jgi:hypothetical protein